MKRIGYLSTIAAIAALAVPLLGVSTANAAESSGRPNAASSIADSQLEAANQSASTKIDVTATASDFLSNYGVDHATIKTLIDEYEHGGKWDSFSSDSEPVRIENSAVDGFNETVNHYADGSVAVTRTEIPHAVDPSGISPMSTVHDCSVSGNMRNNCQADMWVGVISMGFKMSYNAATNHVTNVYGPQWTIGGACSASQTYLSSPASNIARLEVEATLCGIPYSNLFWLQATVSGGVATESWSA